MLDIISGRRRSIRVQIIVNYRRKCADMEHNWTYLIELGEELIWINTVKEVADVRFIEQHVLLEVFLGVPSRLLFLRVNQFLDRIDRLGCIGILTTANDVLDILEHELRVEHFFIDGTSFESHAHHEDLCGLRT